MCQSALCLFYDLHYCASVYDLHYLHGLKGMRMMNKVFAALLLFVSINVYGQDDLFNIQKPEARNGFVFGFGGGVDFPGADMAERYGTSFRAGAQVFYKTKSNWVVGLKYDYLFGNNLRMDSLLINVIDQYGTFIGNGGQRLSVNIYQRGYMFGVQGGKIINLGNNRDNGIAVLSTVGFMEHKVFIRDREQAIPALLGDYKKGYDRLTNGLVLEQFVGYSYFASNGLLNFFIGLNLTAGFTQGRRDYLFDVRRPDNAKRLDLLYGVKAGMYIPIFKRKSEDYYFE